MRRAAGALCHIVAVLAVLAVASGGIAFEVFVWNECRADHSFVYCLRVLGRTG